MNATSCLVQLMRRFVQACGIRQPAERRARRRLVRSAASLLEDRTLLTEIPGLVVTTNSDIVNNSDGVTSLCEAIAFAAVNPGADTITFGDGSALGGTDFTDATTDTITLGGTELSLDSDVTIDGPGATLLSISGNNSSRVFRVGFGVTAEIRDLTITGGSSSNGGGIDNFGTLTVNQSTISGNSASVGGGGIYNAGTLTVNQSTHSGNSTNSDGGGIYSDGTLTVIQSTLSGNSANFNGGGIYNTHILTVIQSTLSGNSARGDGGGILNIDESVTVINSTLVGNRANADGDASGAGGGIWTFNDNLAFTTLYNSIVVGNFVGTGTTASDIANKNLEAASRNSVIGDAGSAGGLANGVNGHIVGAAVADIFTTGTLANNGGPTQTIALKLGGPAMNAGSNANATENGLVGGAALTTDQRGAGFQRIVGPTVDIGAVEFAEAQSLVVTTNSDLVDGSDGVTSLCEAIAFAAVNPGADTITFGDGSALGGTDFTDATTDTITLGGTELILDSDVTIDGPGAALLSISGNNTSRVFLVESGVTAEIRDLTITGGSSSNGGGIYNFGTLTVSQSTISGNSAILGGGIDNFATLTVNQSTISGNSANLGGGIYNSHILTVIQSTLSGNSASGDGGGIFNIDESVTVINSTLVGNRANSDGDASGAGGGIWTANDNRTFTTLYNSIVVGNFVGTGTTANDIAEKNLEAASRNSLIGDAGSAGGLANGVNGHIVGAAVSDIFTTGTLANNGGPTQTIALKPGGPAVNAGSNANATENGLVGGAALTTDQRGSGFARVIDSAVDIGAVEAPETPSLVVTTNSDIVNNSDGLTSLREAIAFAAVNPGADTITFGDGSALGGTDFTDGTPDTILLTLGQLNITTSLTITGNGAANTIIDGGWDGVQGSATGSRIFLIDDGTATQQTVTITGVTLQHGNAGDASFAAGGGGAIWNVEQLTINNDIIIDSFGNHGAGIFNEGVVLSSNNTFAHNTTGISGGAGAYNNSTGTFTSTNDAFTNNASPDDVGGGVVNYGTFTLINGTIANNSADSGGGVFSGGTFNSINATIANNSATIGAGFYDFLTGVWNSNNTIVAGNSGGDVFTNGAPVIVADHTLIGDNTLSGTGITNNVTYAAIFGTNVLANNGGPTQTIALMPGSVAINAGDDSLAVDPDGNALTTDQRGAGFPRFVGTVDIGAFEAPTVLNVNLYGGYMIVDATNNISSNLRISQATGDTVISGLLGTQISFNGAAPVDSVTLTPAQLPTITGITFNLKGGSDTVDIVDTNIAGLVFFNGHLPYFSGPDVDTFNIRSETKDVTIGGPVIAYMSQGDGYFNAKVENAHTLQFNGAVYVYGGFIDAGATHVTISSEDIGSVLNFQSLLYTDLRDGDDGLSIIATRSTINLHGGLLALQGAGNDSLNVGTILGSSITIDAFASIYGDAGNNVVDFSGSTNINGSLTVLGGGGSDNLTFRRGTGLSTSPKISGATTLLLGDGDQTLAASFFTNLGHLFYLGGSGADSIDINRATTTSFTAHLGEGVNLIDADQLISGSALVTGGSATDEVVLKQSTITGSLTALLGGGANQRLELNGSTVTGATFGILTGASNTVRFQSHLFIIGSSVNGVTLITGPGATVDYGDSNGTPLTVTGHTSIFGTTPRTQLNIFAGTPNTFTRTLVNVDEFLL